MPASGSMHSRLSSTIIESPIKSTQSNHQKGVFIWLKDNEVYEAIKITYMLILGMWSDHRYFEYT